MFNYIVFAGFHFSHFHITTLTGKEGRRGGIQKDCFTVALEDYSWRNTNILASNLLELGVWN